MASADPIRQLPVLIVGAGPAGLVTAVTLARNGIATLLVERIPGLSPLPRATAVSTRTMELLRSWGLEDEVRAGQLDITAVGAWTAETMASPDGVLMPLGHPDLEQAAAASPTRLAGVPQDHWEPVLLRHLETFGLAEVRFGTELVALDQDTDGVTVALRDRATGERRTVRSGYVIGADGAHSQVRSLLGIAMDGPGHLDEQLTVLFEAPLADVVGDRRYGIYFIQHPEAGGVFVPNGSHGRWLYGRGWDPAHERLEDYTDDRLAGLIRTAAGVPDLPVRVVAKGAFSFAAQVAERYREGRAFLVGDAAQRMTPRGGMGMNTAVAEGHDLGWKLAWVLRGWAGPGLLDTYEAEWRPVGARRTARSADPGPEAPGAEALAEDLNGRLPHAWLPNSNGHRRSTLDLLGQGLTLFTGPDPHPWTAATATLDPAFPLDVHALDHRTRRNPRPRPRRRPPGPPRRPGHRPLAHRPHRLAGRPGRSRIRLARATAYSKRPRSSAVIPACRRMDSSVPRGSTRRCNGTMTVRRRSRRPPGRGCPRSRARALPGGWRAPPLGCRRGWRPRPPDSGRRRRRQGRRARG
jgi:putative polyketide hydroxylase